MKTNKMGPAIAVALLTSSTVVFAQVPYVRPAYQFPVAPEGSGPVAIQVGSSPVYFTPYLGAAVGRDDNLFLSSSNEKSSTLYIVSPGLRLDARDANKYLQ